MSDPSPVRFVSRAGFKLQHALEAFGVAVTGLDCADFGCNAGGFTDCLLQRGARRVVALDTGYGMLDWRLRNDARVDVRERTNALHAPAPSDGVDLVVMDLAWTCQRHAVPAALRWLRPNGRIITLIKPHYESQGTERKALVKGALPPAIAATVVERVLGSMPELGARVLADSPSPVIGGGGNSEHLALLAPR
ncbi:MAG: methyltransferase domain-containing protein [Planctomycetes bacterium]|nr:methyltransferase domain-containing protein [Planctomycetota bacterium]